MSDNSKKSNSKSNSQSNMSKSSNNKSSKSKTTNSKKNDNSSKSNNSQNKTSINNENNDNQSLVNIINTKDENENSSKSKKESFNSSKSINKRNNERYREKALDEEYFDQINNLQFYSVRDLRPMKNVFPLDPKQIQLIYSSANNNTKLQMVEERIKNLEIKNRNLEIINKMFFDNLKDHYDQNKYRKKFFDKNLDLLRKEKDTGDKKFNQHFSFLKYLKRNQNVIFDSKGNTNVGVYRDLDKEMDDYRKELSKIVSEEQINSNQTINFLRNSIDELRNDFNKRFNDLENLNKKNREMIDQIIEIQREKQSFRDSKTNSQIDNQKDNSQQKSKSISIVSSSNKNESEGIVDSRTSSFYKNESRASSFYKKENYARKDNLKNETNDKEKEDNNSIASSFYKKENKKSTPKIIHSTKRNENISQKSQLHSSNKINENKNTNELNIQNKSNKDNTPNKSSSRNEESNKSQSSLNSNNSKSNSKKDNINEIKEKKKRESLTEKLKEQTKEFEARKSKLVPKIPEEIFNSFNVKKNENVNLYQ